VAGFKTRRYDNIRAEVEAFFDVHDQVGRCGRRPQIQLWGDAAAFTRLRPHTDIECGALGRKGAGAQGRSRAPAVTDFWVPVPGGGCIKRPGGLRPPREPARAPLAAIVMGAERAAGGPGGGSPLGCRPPDTRRRRLPSQRRTPLSPRPTPLFQTPPPDSSAPCPAACTWR
jgi:hypothetical protein